MNIKVIFIGAALSSVVFGPTPNAEARTTTVGYTAPTQTVQPQYALKLANFDAGGDLKSVSQIELFNDQQSCQVKITSIIHQITHYTTRSLGENVLTDGTGDLAEFICTPVNGGDKSQPKFHTKEQLMQLLLEQKDDSSERSQGEQESQDIIGDHSF
jgi:hypothetical protein